jgi:superfamily II DNA helicase RecQ
MPGSSTASSLDAVRAVIARHWGFRELRPLQDQAMQAVLDGRDSLVVMPTGGGKSLCYQAPAVYRGGTTVVVSPLIALMKDQVDSLRACGIAATQLDSSLSGVERIAYEKDLRQGALSLLACLDRHLPRVAEDRRAHLRHRRSPLHQPLGPRFPPRIPPDEPAA